MRTRGVSNVESIERLRRRNTKLTALLDVATAMSRERNIDVLLDRILEESMRAVDADRGSLFIMVDEGTALLSKIAHGERDEIKVRVGEGIAGYVARTGTPLNIPDAYSDPRFNPEVDKVTGYHTKSILCVPMLGGKGEVVGVVQALNHDHGAFTEEDEELLMAFGANAASALENANLHREREVLFEQFVQASVTAIEARDPTTAGHSGRVASLSEEMMKAVDHDSGPFDAVKFSLADLREMRYAALLHDFGKVGVREHVLVKAEKLYPHELELLEQRFEQARRSAEVEALEARVRLFESGPRDTAVEEAHRIEERLRQRLSELDEMLAFIRKCNLPTVLEEGGFERLTDIGGQTFLDSTRSPRYLLRAEDVTNLSIGRGSLNEKERKEIESHVVHTFNFLKLIPWTRDLRRVPEIARGHHEKLTGRGYPLGVGAEEIPTQTRIMTIADIYDALTASDRPYKKAMPHQRALDILGFEARDGNIDRDLLNVFIEADIAGRALKKEP